MKTGKKLLGALVVLAAFAGSASAQTAANWVNRQTHGLARHITPRHHKPGHWRPQRMVIVHHHRVHHYHPYHRY